MQIGAHQILTHVRIFFTTADVSAEIQDWGLAVKIREPKRHRLSFEINIMGSHVSWSVSEEPYNKVCTITSQRLTIDRLNRNCAVYDTMAMEAVEAYQAFTQLVKDFQYNYESNGSSA